MSDNKYTKREGRWRAGIFENTIDSTRLHFFHLEEFLCLNRLLTFTMYFLGVVALFLVAAHAAVTADVLVTKLNWFGRNVMFLQSPGARHDSMDSILIEHKLGGAYVRPLRIPRPFSPDGC